MHDLDFLFLNIFCVAVKAQREKISFISIRQELRNIFGLGHPL
jgi:hypothetical protein